MDKIADREQARCMAAVSAGQELMPRYVELILKCGKPEKIAEKYLFKLVQWKDTRELFWSEDSVTSLPGSSQVFSIVASIKNVVPKISALSVSDEIIVIENQVCIWWGYIWLKKKIILFCRPQKQTQQSKCNPQRESFI